jgi:hypothetical protein
MLMRKTLLAATFSLCAVAAFAAHPATLVLNNGQRVSGMLSYDKSADITLEVDGQSRRFPFDQIAIVSFESGDPSGDELRQLPEGNNPPELERHMFVLRNGQIIHGKLYEFSADGGTVTFDPRDGGMAARRSVRTDEVRRIYLSAPGARNVYNDRLSSPAAPSSQAVATAGQGAITVPGNQAWTDTGIMVRRGNRLSFRTTGEIEISPNANTGPDGSVNFPTQPGARYPVPGMPVGGLIGRVGNGRPFPIGSNTQPIVVNQDGRLFLGINDDVVNDNNGSFSVTIER